MDIEASKNLFFSRLWLEGPEFVWACELSGSGDPLLAAWNPPLERRFPYLRTGQTLIQAFGQADRDWGAYYRASHDLKKTVILTHRLGCLPEDPLMKIVLSPPLNAGDPYIWARACDAEITSTPPEFGHKERLEELEAGNMRLARTMDELAQKNMALEEECGRYLELALKDPLTGLANRRGFQEAVAREYHRARRYGRGLSLMLVDMDGLKRMNDEYGHPFGDEAIKAVAGVLAEACRSSDLAARLGGDEFALILPEASLEHAVALGQRGSDCLSAKRLYSSSGECRTISMSVGIASLKEEDTGFDALYARADKALYRAKNSGMGKVDFEP